MPKKAKSKAGELIIALGDPGMTEIHRAGLGGLAMTLERIGLRDTVSENRVHLRWGEEGPEELIKRIFTEGLAIDADVGLINFPALRDRLGSPPSYEARLLMQEALTGTFIQHGKSRTLGEVQPLTLDPDATAVPLTYRPLRDFKHQGEWKTVVAQLEKKTRKTIRIVGWALPGAVERHPGSAWSRMEATVEQFMALCFAPIGCFSFHVNHRIRGLSQSHALVVPEVQDLKSYARLRRRLNDLTTEQLTVASAADAGLLVSIALHSGLKRVERGGQRLCSVIALGVQPWASQQRTRTLSMQIRDPEGTGLSTETNNPNSKLLATYKLVSTIREFQPRRLRGKNGYWYATSPSRGAIAESIVGGRVWWQGLMDSYRHSDASTRNTFHFPTEERGLATMVENAPESTDWRHDVERTFIHACHRAMSQLYAYVQSVALNHEDGNRKYSVELTKFRSHLLRAKTADGARGVVMSFLSRANRSRVMNNRVMAGKEEPSDWSNLLTLFDDKNWRKLRDLALLALISRPGKQASADGDDSDSENTNEDAET